MNEGEFSGGPVQSNPEEQGIFASQEPTTPEQSADTANQVTFSSADATASQSGKSTFDNSNSFDRPQGAISSEADDAGDNDEPEHNFSFGGRSRRGSTGRRNFDAEPQNTFTPNPNAPAFFNDAMASMTPVEQPKSNKNFLKIGIIAAVAILVVGGGILVAVLAGRGGGSGGGSDVKLDEKKVAELEELLDGAVDDFTPLEDYIRVSTSSGISLADFSDEDFADEYVKNLEESLEKTKSFNDSLQAYKGKFSATRNAIDIDKNIQELKDVLAARMTYYEKAPRTASAFKEAVKEGTTKDAKKILSDKIGDDSFNSVGEAINGYYADMKSYTNTILSNNCSGDNNSQVCVDTMTNMMKTKDDFGSPTLTQAALIKYFKGYKYDSDKNPSTLLSNIRVAIEEGEEDE